ncbi:MAG: hypothetical protein K2W78_13045 [Xanthobacteraceae bacterium]|nr:hypothetical protein [Xanthobacteraceae bacterium]
MRDPVGGEFGAIVSRKHGIEVLIGRSFSGISWLFVSEAALWFPKRNDDPEVSSYDDPDCEDILAR